MVSLLNCRFLLVIMCFFSGWTSLAQFEKDRIYQYNDSLTNVISHYRSDVYHQLKSGNGNSVQINYGYESMKISGYNGSLAGASAIGTGEHYLDLNEIESIYLIQHNFDGILEIIRNNGFELEEGERIERIDPRETTSNKNVRRYNRFGGDSLGYRIGTLLLHYKPEIVSEILSINQTEEVKDFLQLYMDYKILNLWDVWLSTKPKEVWEANFEQCQNLDSLTYKNAEEFIEKYQDSEFNSFINTYMLPKYAVKNWAVGMDPIYLGTLIPTGELWNYMKVPILYANLGLRVYYKNAFVNVMGGITATGLRQNIYQDTLWTSGFTMLTGDITLGYCLDFKKNFTVTPLVGIRSIANIGPKNDGKSASFKSQSPWTFGMELSYGGLRKAKNTVSSRFSRTTVRDGIGLKVMYQNPKYEQVLPELSGGLWTVTLGLNLAMFRVIYDD
ncbi:MAG: hypothetical protein ACI8ZM_003567 [Crocinitomix sp.]|jgi:hypothetical protein